MFQCDSCLLSFFYCVPYGILLFALVRIVTLYCKSNTDMNVCVRSSINIILKLYWCNRTLSLVCLFECSALKSALLGANWWDYFNRRDL